MVSSDLVRAEQRTALREAVEPFEHPCRLRAVWQIFSSAGFYVATVGLMYWSLSFSYWLTLVLALPAGALLVRTFVVQHDCGHRSFFASQRANDIVGALLGVLTFAPYQNWRRQHWRHHANWNNLDRREHGADIYSACLTVKEYLSLSPLARLLYRVPRHPLLAHLVFPPLVFLVLYRFPFDTPPHWVAERRTVWATNAAVACWVLLLGMLLGIRAVLLVQLPIVALSSTVGVWLFSVQHRFETARWWRAEEWTFHAAALTGSSYLKLPRWLEWITGSIGYHHIHHLAPRIPNYRLADCYWSALILRTEKPLSVRAALSASTLTLWDEARGRLVRFRDANP